MGDRHLSLTNEEKFTFTFFNFYFLVTFNSSEYYD